MANFCSNRVAFEGSKTAITKLQSLFLEMSRLQEQTGKGQLPDFIKAEDGYFFDLYWDDGDLGIFCYETRWAPNTTILTAIADKYRVGFVLDYEELGNLIYGRAVYRNRQFQDIYLETEDFDMYSLDLTSGLYNFEGNEYEEDYEILETLLDRKIALSPKMDASSDRKD